MHKFPCYLDWIFLGKGCVVFTVCITEEVKFITLLAFNFLLILWIQILHHHN